MPTITQDALGVTAQGNLISSNGSTAWFRPSAEVKSVTFIYLNQDDDEDPTSGHFWFAQTIAIAPLPDTGLSSSAMITLLVAGSSLLVAGGLLVARRRG